jgi:hypothetical protein
MLPDPVDHRRIKSDWFTENIRGSATKSFSVDRQNEILEAAT